jgi:DNA polymerase I
MPARLPYRAVVAADFEYEFGGHNYANLPRPVCMSWRDLLTGRGGNVWLQGETVAAPPFSVGPDTLFVAYNATAEIGCFRILGWPEPARVLDLYPEFANLINGVHAGRKGLVHAMEYFGLDSLSAVEKKAIVERILTGPPYSEQERREIAEYCDSDVDALARLLPAMIPFIDLPRALLRGRYMANLAAVQNAGAPIDLPLYRLFVKHCDSIKDLLVAEIDKDFGVYEGHSFREDLFEKLLVRLGIPWPLLDSGRLALDKDTFREMARSYPIISPLRELRHHLTEMRIPDLAVSDDGRNRTSLFPFSSRTGRNQPGSNKFIFGLSTYLRGLIKPPEGFGVAYLDWKSQEVGIAAALSGDERMMADFLTGDPYIAFGIEAGILPHGATKESHKEVRNMIKTCVLGVQYGMGDRTLAARISSPRITARELIRAYRERYSKFWKMAEASVDIAMLGGFNQTVFGWRVRGVVDKLHPFKRVANSMLNFPMQANGAEMLRVAICLAVERGIEVVAPVHDAMMIMAPLDRLDADIEATKNAMLEASRAVLGGFEVGIDCEQIVRYPDRYMDERGRVMWGKVVKLVMEAEQAERGKDVA